MHTQPSRNMSRSSSSSTQVAGRVNPAWFPEAQFLIWCARTSLSDVTRSRIREAAQAGLKWPLLLDLARYHGVGPLLYRTISTVCADLVPKDSLDALRQVTQAGTLLNRVLAGELVQLCRAFDESGVPVVPFKGATLAAMAYKDLSLRDFDDLDFIVPQHRVADVKRVLWSQGYRPRDRSQDEPDAAHADEPYHVFVKKSSVLRVDLQWVMAHDQFTFHLDRPEIWDQLIPVSIDGHQVRGLAPEDLLLILCVHGSKHAWERLKWVADVAELLRAQELNWKRVFSTATKWKCRRMLLLGLELANRLMEIPLPSDVLSEISADQDVTVLARRMPKSVLTHQHDGIDEHDGPALYFALKDSWWDRWRYGLVLVRHDHPMLTRLPSWFRWAKQIMLLARIGEFFRASAVIRAMMTLRRAIGRSNRATY